MWLQVSVLYLSCLVLTSQSQGDDRASLRRSNNHNGKCQYTFTVASPEESSCLGGSAGPEMEGALSRLSLLEALVSRLVAGGEEGDSGTRVGSNSEEGLQEAYSQVTAERDQLQKHTEQLNIQLQELQKRLEELSQEAETLRQTPCPQRQTSGKDQHEGSQRPSNGMYSD